MGKTILLIDDDVEFLEVLKSALEAKGYNICALSDPMKTEDYIEKHKPSLIIIDILMPGRSGFNIIEDFNDKGIYQDIPKVFLTGLDDDIEKLIAESSGVVQYLTKPFRPEELVSCIEKSLV